VRSAGDPAADFPDVPADTFNLSHDCGVPVKDIAALMGHAGVSTQFIYVQTLDDAKRAASERIGEKLVTIGHRSDIEVDDVN
jgi:integrase